MSSERDAPETPHEGLDTSLEPEPPEQSTLSEFQTATASSSDESDTLADPSMSDLQDLILEETSDIHERIDAIEQTSENVQNLTSLVEQNVDVLTELAEQLNDSNQLSADVDDAEQSIGFQ